MTALQIFRVVASEFSDIPDNDVTDESGEITKYGVKTYIDLFSDQISEKRFGSTYNKAIAYLTAHKLKMLGFGDDNGLGTIADALRVSSFSEGESSISFANNQSGNMDVDGEYSLTVYGVEFLTLKRNAIIPIVSSGECFCL